MKVNKKGFNMTKLMLEPQNVMAKTNDLPWITKLSTWISPLLITERPIDAAPANKVLGS